MTQQVVLDDRGDEVQCVHAVEIKTRLRYNFALVPAVAEGQHANLRAALSSVPGQRAELNVPPLGVAGGVLRFLADKLVRLGVQCNLGYSEPIFVQSLFAIRAFLL